MKFSEYMAAMAKRHGFCAWFADELDVHKTRVYAWKSGSAAIPLWAWERIERTTNGQVTILEIYHEQLDLFHANSKGSVSKSEESDGGELPCGVDGRRMPDSWNKVSLAEEAQAMGTNAWSHGPKPRGRPRKISVPEVQRSGDEHISADERQGSSRGLHSKGTMDLAKDTAEEKERSQGQAKGIGGHSSKQVWGAPKAKDESVDGSAKAREFEKAEFVTPEEARAKLGIKKLEPKE